MSDAVPNGSCVRCECALSSVSCERDGHWYCCGGCVGSDRCSCGCQPDHARGLTSDVYVPGRRMFGSRHPDELRTPDGFDDRQRAFPFADRRRGR